MLLGRRFWCCAHGDPGGRRRTRRSSDTSSVLTGSTSGSLKDLPLIAVQREAFGILGRHLCRLSCPSSGDRPTNSVQGVVAQLSDPSAQWQDPFLEQGRRRAHWSGSFDRSRTFKRPNSRRVAWRRCPSSVGTGGADLGNSFGVTPGLCELSWNDCPWNMTN